MNDSNEKIKTEENRAITVDDILAEALERRREAQKTETKASPIIEESETPDCTKDDEKPAEKAEEPMPQKAPEPEREEETAPLQISDEALLEEKSDETQEEGEKEEAPSKTEIIYEWVEEILTAMAMVAIIFSFFFKVVTVFGTSMQPNFYEKDKLIVSSFIYDIEPGDVVVAVDVLDEPIIKRVIAVGGQTVDIDNETGTVYVDGKALDEKSYTENNKTFALGSDKISFPITVEEGCIFVLGDNRTVSKDSRFSAVGQISEENILGEVKLRIYPFSNIGIIK